MRSTRGSTTKAIVTDGQAVSTFATTSCLLRHGKCFGSGERKGKDGPNPMGYHQAFVRTLMVGHDGTVHGGA